MKKTYKDLEYEKRELNLKRKELKNQLKELDFKIAKIERHQHKLVKEVTKTCQTNNKN